MLPMLLGLKRLYGVLPLFLGGIFRDNNTDVVGCFTKKIKRIYYFPCRAYLGYAGN
jgi:hypothetical protein